MMSPTPASPTPLDAATDARLDEVVAASEWLANTTLTERGAILRAVADALSARSDEIVGVAAEETLLPIERLRGEQARTVNQLHLSAEVVEDGEWLGASITHARPEAIPPVQDHRRVNVPLGPVIVFAASNFPLAFGIGGTDTASALAAGCAVVAKGHPGHPRLARLLADTIGTALADAGAPDAAFTLLDSAEAVSVLQDPRIAAGAFTGSITGGTSLAKIAEQRAVPIPFYAEMGSVNPVVVTAAAWRARRDEILTGLVESMTISNGQLCTSPGVVFVPEADLSVAQLDGFMSSTRPGTMLTDDIADGFRAGVRSLAETEGVDPAGEVHVAPGRAAHPVLWLTDTATVERSSSVLQERFGPSSVVVRYAAESDLVRAIAGIEGQLTASVFAEPGEDVGALVQALAARAGRVLLNAWPTGVAVSWSMHHGGPWPASSAVKFGSVGAEAIDRFVRPLAFQNFTDDLLPAPLKEANPWGIRRRVDGVHEKRGTEH